MAKTREYNFLYVILTFFVCLLPTFGSVMDEKAVIYTSFCVLWSAVGYIIYKKGCVPVTKVTIFCMVTGLWSMAQIIFVSDKGGQFALGTLFLAAAAGSIIMQECKASLGENMREFALRITYISAAIYALCAVLFQIFISTDFLGHAMNLSKGSPTGAAILMLAGLIASMKLVYSKPKSPKFFVFMALMVYVFIMTKSLVGYLAASVVFFVFALKIRHKKAEAFLSLLVAIALGIVNLGYVAFSFIAGNVELDGMAAGIKSVFGLGNGGYSALTSILGEKAHSVQSFAFICEVFGVVGIIMIILLVREAVKKAGESPSIGNVMLLVAIIAILLTPKAALVFAIPVLAMYMGARSEIRDVRVKKFVSAVLLLPVGMCACFMVARCGYAVAYNMSAVGDYKKAEDVYSLMASMELFNSEGWIKAYEASRKDMAENGTDTLLKQEEYLTNAIKFNPDNYEYQRLLAQNCAERDNWVDSLSLWEKIIENCNAECLYPEYAQTICDAMANTSPSLLSMEDMYGKIENLANSCTDSEIRFLVNNILTRSQKYYISAREGDEVVADMYTYSYVYEPGVDPTDIPTENMEEPT